MPDPEVVKSGVFDAPHRMRDSPGPADWKVGLLSRANQQKYQRRRALADLSRLLGVNRACAAISGSARDVEESPRLVERGCTKDPAPSGTGPELRVLALSYHPQLPELTG